MDIEYLEKLVKLISESRVDEIEIEEEGKKIRIAKSVPGAGMAPAVQYGAVHTVQPLVGQSVPDAGTPVAGTPSAASPAIQYHEIRSPIVGTFYRAPAPDAAPFVEVGSQIGPGTVLCTVEAMKLMNEIDSDVAGRIHKILVENGQPVEYDQVMFLVEKG